MKKIVLLLLLGGTLSIGTFANVGLGKPTSKKETKKKKKNVKPGRECCTVKIGVERLGTWSTTECAGWLFSNSAAAYARACKKAQAKMLKFFTNPPKFEIGDPDPDGGSIEISPQ